MKRVALGMSGGVDSSVSAILLMNEGYEVIPIFMRNWDSLVNNEFVGVEVDIEDICPQEQDYLDALTVCKVLGLKLHRVNFVEEYWNDVFKYFLDELSKSRTPNPDVMCNKYVKFGAFKDAASKFNVDYYAFGHYANITHENGTKLLTAIDTNKDQTYFLSLLSSEQLKDVLFPLGNYTKSEVRKLAIEYNLPTAVKKDSTGICFIGERNFPQFLTNYFKANSGDIINIDNNNVVGTHYGLFNYTIGQRKGLNIGGYSSSLFVVAKSVSKNILYVSNDENKLVSHTCILEDINWITPFDDSLTYVAKFRYRQEYQDVKIKFINNEFNIIYPQGVKAVTPGQICVIYHGNQCYGGGIIKTVLDSNLNTMVYINEEEL